MLERLAYAASYTVVGIVLLVVGFVVLDLLVPGRLTSHIWHDRSRNAALVASAGMLGLGAVVFTAIWTNATAGFGAALGWTVAFGLLGVALQAVAFVVLDLLTPGRLGAVVGAVEDHPAALVVAASQLAVSAIVVASIA